MTLPRMTISLDQTMATWMMNELENGRFILEDHAEVAAFEDTMERLKVLYRAFSLMAKAALLDENEHFAVYEHPKWGDEGTVMIFDKKAGRFFEESPFWEPEMEEIEDWLVNHVYG